MLKWWIFKLKIARLKFMMFKINWSLTTRIYFRYGWTFDWNFIVIIVQRENWNWIFKGWWKYGFYRCNDDWTGTKCDQKPCDPRCAEHGQCKNGTCVCSQGWNGRHCTLRKYYNYTHNEAFKFIIIDTWSYKLWSLFKIEALSNHYFINFVARYLSETKISRRTQRFIRQRSMRLYNQPKIN